jgi:peptide-methionine (S)-S-oxide reductase
VRNRAGNWVNSGYNAGSSAGAVLSGQLVGRIPLSACLPVLAVPALLAITPLLPFLTAEHCSPQSCASQLRGCTGCAGRLLRAACNVVNFGGRSAMSENTETAILAGGCFWPAQHLLRHRTGVISTRVGYTGGENDNPTAGNHPGHAEAVEVIFDPGQTSYRNILEFFFQIHRPDLDEGRVGSDYRSEIFYTSDEQRQVAEDTIAAADASGMWPGAVVTKFSQAGPFWEAEAEDQDYLQRYSDGNNQFSPYRSPAR